MRTTRVKFPAVAGFPAFSVEVPEGFTEPTLTRGDIDLNEPDVAETLALLASPSLGAHLCVGARPAYEEGCVEDWARDLCRRFGLRITGCVSGFVGGPAHTHPGVFVEAECSREGEPTTLRIALIEDGRRLFTIHTCAPAGAWARMGETLERVTASLELTDAVGPTLSCVSNGPVPILDMYGVTIGGWPRGRDAVPIDTAALERGRAAAVERARTLVAAGRFEEAERLLSEVDPYFHYAVAASRVYEDHLRAIVSEGVKGSRRTLAEEVFMRAHGWSLRCYPDPHTSIEAEDFERGRAADRARLVDILGFDPDRSDG